MHKLEITPPEACICVTLDGEPVGVPCSTNGEDLIPYSIEFTGEAYIRIRGELVPLQDMVLGKPMPAYINALYGLIYQDKQRAKEQAVLCGL